MFTHSMCVGFPRKDGARHFFTAEVIRFIMDISGDGVDSNNEGNMFKEERDAEFDRAVVNGN